MGINAKRERERESNFVIYWIYTLFWV